MINKTFQYKDGGEQRLLDIFSQEIDEYTTWREYKHVWSLFYHLSPLRKNILAWYDFEPNCSVLEIGGGCGALTSYLCRVPEISKLTTLEGAEARAESIRKRCRNAPSLEVITQNLQDYETDARYDYVVINGVLEYSGRYIDGENPYAAFINLAAQFLKPDGQLIIAIENKLGHKYLAGNNEDHYGVPFEGISNYPNYDGIRTFDKKELSQLLDNTGFPHQEWYYPFPDYKFPRVVFSENAFHPDFDWSALLETPTVDRSFRGKLLFNEKAFLKSVANNTSPGIFMNSFLVFASKTIQPESNETELAVKMNSHRWEEHCANKHFVRKRDGIIQVVEKNPGDKEDSRSEYHKGFSNLNELLTEAMYSGNEGIIEKYLSVWFSELDKVSSSDAIHKEKLAAFAHSELRSTSLYADETEFVPFHHFDLISNNILLNKITGERKIIDQEYSFHSIHVPKQFVIDRGILYLLLKMVQLNKIEHILTLDRKWNFNLPADLQSVDFSSLRTMERYLNGIIYKGEIDTAVVHDESWHTEYMEQPKQGLSSKGRLANRMANVLRKSFIIRRLSEKIARVDSAK